MHKVRAVIVRVHVKAFILINRLNRVQHRVTIKVLDDWVEFRRGRGDYHSPKESM